MNRLSLTPVLRILTWCLHLLMAGLLTLAVARTVADEAPHPVAVAVTAAVVALVYAAGPLIPHVGLRTLPTAGWLGVLGLAWLVLMALTSFGVWIAFPLYFVQLHLLPRRPGIVAVGVTALAAITGYVCHEGDVTVAAFIGPALGGAVAVATVLGYQALYSESDQRRELIQELTATRAELAAAGHIAGAMAERERLAREIHDTLAQGLSSIQLLLRAAERELTPEDEEGTAPAPAVRYVEQARKAAQDNLAEARRFVHALVPPDLDGDGEDASLHAALERLCDTTTVRHGVPVHFHLSGRPLPLPAPSEVALLRIGQSALANAVTHADAHSVEITLTYMEGQVALDVVDDGSGFDLRVLPPPEPGQGGFGLAAMRARARALGGTLTVESSPGHGTAIAAQLPAHPLPGEEESAP